MKIKTIIVGLTALGLSSCGSSVALEDINVSDLNTACDCADAQVAGMEKFKEFKANEAKYTDADGNETEAVNKAEAKMQEIGMHCEEKGFTRDEMKECPSLKSFMEANKP